MDSRKDVVLGAVARGWCSEKNSGKTMDVDLAEAITEEIMLLAGNSKLDIEKEMSQLYDATEDPRVRLDLLNSLHSIRLQTSAKAAKS